MEFSKTSKAIAVGFGKLILERILKNSLEELQKKSLAELREVIPNLFKKKSGWLGVVRI